MLSAMYAESHFLIIMLSVIMLDVGVLSVVAPMEARDKWLIADCLLTGVT